MPSPHLVRQPADGDLGEKKIRQMGFARRRPGAWVFSFGLHVLALILLGCGRPGEAQRHYDAASSCRTRAS